jgi:hypothetical protein
MAWLGKLFAHRKRDEHAYARKLYETIVASKASDSECEFDNLLEYCAILFEPDNCQFYVEYDEKNKLSVPDYLPADYKALVNNCTKLCCSMMWEMLSEQYLAHPRLEELEGKLEQLGLEECMQFFLYYIRLSLRHGQQYFFEKWRDGTALRVVRRMQQLRKNR